MISLDGGVLLLVLLAASAVTVAPQSLDGVALRSKKKRSEHPLLKVLAQEGEDRFENESHNRILHPDDDDSSRELSLYEKAIQGYCSTSYSDYICGLSENNENLVVDGGILKLTQDVCCNNTAIDDGPTLMNGAILDCDGHTITGGGSVFDGTGVTVDGSSGSVVRNCVITNFENGIQVINNSNDVVIRNVHVHSNKKYGIQVDSSERIIVRKSVITNNNLGLFFFFVNTIHKLVDLLVCENQSVDIESTLSTTTIEYYDGIFCNKCNGNGGSINVLFNDMASNISSCDTQCML